MKKTLILISFLTATLLGKAQVISGDIGFAANATPTFFFSPVINAQFHLKANNYIGMGILSDWARDRTTYVARFGTSLNKRFYFNSGIGFVNDWTTKNPDGSNVTYRTYIIGVDYVFKKPWEHQPFNFYTGFDFTDEIIYLKVGVKFGHEKRAK